MDNETQQQLLAQRHQNTIDISELYNLRKQGINGERRAPIVARLQADGVNPEWFDPNAQSRDAEHFVGELAQDYALINSLTRQALPNPDDFTGDDEGYAVAVVIREAQNKAFRAMKQFLSGVDYTLGIRDPREGGSNWFDLDLLSHDADGITKSARLAAQQAKSQKEQQEFKDLLGRVAIAIADSL
jgi:hypothetical protein